jgi:hypothetical protein
VYVVNQNIRQLLALIAQSTFLTDAADLDAINEKIDDQILNVQRDMDQLPHEERAHMAHDPNYPWGFWTT